MKIVFATNNQHKLSEIRSILGDSIEVLSLKDIGEQFEGRNHATVLSSIRKIEELVQKDSKMAETIRDITSNITSKNSSL